MRKRFIAVGLLAMSLFGGYFLVNQAQAKTAVDDHERIVRFWTKDRVARAIPRDFVRDPKTGRFSLKGGRFDSGFVTGASWNLGGEVAQTTGKVLFSMGGMFYVCSASVVDDAVSNRAIISTAAHCVYDEVAGEFASNWMFVPAYDTAPVSLTGNGSFCAETTYGCWTASHKIVSSDYATAGAFNYQAVLHDYAFVAVGAGGKLMTQLDTAVGSQPIEFLETDFETNAYLFGYPATGRYKGKDLTYCNGLTYLDIRMDYETYQVGCTMTGGSSGGPWFKNFNDSGALVGTGTQYSVNSYGYNGSKNMYGPMFNVETEGMFNTSTTMTSDTVFSMP